MVINGKNVASSKDHKPNFLNNLKTLLLNPAKNELGRISKVMLGKVNLNLRNSTKVNQSQSLAISSVRLKASKSSKIVSLFHLI